jgi:hypothetical protein
VSVRFVMVVPLSFMAILSFHPVSKRSPFGSRLTIVTL